MLLELLLEVWLLVLLYYLLPPPLHLHGGVEENRKNISLMFQVSIFPKRTKPDLRTNLTVLSLDRCFSS